MRIILITLTFSFSICVKAQDQSCVSLFQQSQVELSDEVTEGLYKLAVDQVRTQKLPMSESKNMILREIKRQVFEKANEFDSPEVVFSTYRSIIAALSRASRESTESIQTRNENRKHKDEILKQQKKLQKIEDLKNEYANENLENVFCLAAARNDIETIKLLLEYGVNINAKLGEETALHSASRFGNIETVKLLLKAGIDTSVQNDQNETALNIAAVVGSAEIMKLLLDAGTTIDNKDFLGYTALLNTVRRGNITTTSLLLEAGANTEMLENIKQKKTALHLAMDRENTQVMRLLLAANANIEAQDNYGRTVLIRASREGYTEVVKLLLEAGANIGAVDQDGYTALKIAKLNKNQEIVQLLKEAEKKQTKDSPGLINRFKNWWSR